MPADLNLGITKHSSTEQRPKYKRASTASDQQYPSNVIQDVRSRQLEGFLSFQPVIKIGSAQCTSKTPAKSILFINLSSEEEQTKKKLKVIPLVSSVPRGMKNRSRIFGRIKPCPLK